MWIIALKDKAKEVTEVCVWKELERHVYLYKSL
jgi:hypothetical protein